MESYATKNYEAFDLFRSHWALVSAGSLDDFNACTVSWGSLGTLWTREGGSGSTVTVYLHPSRYTREYAQENDTFTVSFFPASCKRALALLGARSGRDGNKMGASGLTPVAMGGGVGFDEAELTFLCRKVYQHQLAKEGIAPDVQQYYRDNPKAYPVDENGDWQPHWVFVGEILDVVDRR